MTAEFTVHMKAHHSMEQATTTSPRVRFQELAHVWAIAHSLLLNRVYGLTIYMILNLVSWSPPVSEDAPVLLRTAAPGDCLLSQICIYITLCYIFSLVTFGRQLKIKLLGDRDERFDMRLRMF